MRELIIDGHRIADDTEPFLIAEIGNNHQGDVEQARRLIDMAVLCGASAVKFQKRDNRALFTQAAYHAPYVGRHSFGPTYGRHRDAVELSADDFRDLKAHANQRGITFFATPFDVPSADLLADLDVPVFKIASADLTNTLLLRHVARFGKPMIVSTGGGTLTDVDRAVSTILPINPALCLLQCTASYPAPARTLNLRVIEIYRERYPDLVIGYSGHEVGKTLAVVAYALGARVIEKHVTLDHSLKGTDQAFSLDQEELRALRGGLLLAKEALGDGVKQPDPVERAAMAKMAKSLYTTRSLPAGHVLTEADLSIKCPGGGMPPYDLERVIGQRLLVDLGCEDALLPAHVDWWAA